MIKKIAVDLDGVLCEETKPYAKAKPIENNIEILRTLRDKYKIIVYTSRRKKDRKLTLEWLRKHNVPFDLLVLDKLKVDYYIDDRCVKLEDLWKK